MIIDIWWSFDDMIIDIWWSFSTTGADQSRIMQDQISGAAMAMPADTNKAFKVS